MCKLCWFVSIVLQHTRTRTRTITDVPVVGKTFGGTTGNNPRMAIWYCSMWSASNNRNDCVCCWHIRMRRINIYYPEMICYIWENGGTYTQKNGAQDWWRMASFYESFECIGSILCVRKSGHNSAQCIAVCVYLHNRCTLREDTTNAYFTLYSSCGSHRTTNLTYRRDIVVLSGSNVERVLDK